MPLPTFRQLDGRRRRAVLAYAGIGAWLVPWSAFLAATVPSTATVSHWNLAWCGLDLGEASAAAAAAWFTVRGDRRSARAAVVLTVLLCVDAWFDVCTARPGLPRTVAVAEAVLLELPLAAASAWWSTKLETVGAAAVLPHR